MYVSDLNLYLRLRILNLYLLHDYIYMNMSKYDSWAILN
jgi:hypothetical protein